MPGSTVTTADIEAFKSMRAEGLSVKEMSRRTGTAVGTIAHWLGDNPRKSRSGRRMRPIVIDENGIRLCSRCETYPAQYDAANKTHRRCERCLREYMRAQHQRRKYGLEPEQVEEMRERQGGTCAFSWCDRDDLVVDHCHDTGAVRGLLCAPHNMAIGRLGDSPEKFAEILAYMEAGRHAV